MIFVHRSNLTKPSWRITGLLNVSTVYLNNNIPDLLSIEMRILWTPIANSIFSSLAWTSKPAKQDVVYEDEAGLQEAVTKLSKLPPLVTPKEVSAGYIRFFFSWLYLFTDI